MITAVLEKEDLHSDDGYIKYNCVFTKAQPLAMIKLHDLNQWRQKLYVAKLIGAYPNKVGYGNVSQRIAGTNQFIISGTETGNYLHLNENHYTVVTNVNIEQNTLWCTGPIKASSEAMTHAAIYMTDPAVNAVIHIHNPQMWQELLNKVPTTNIGATYGTPQMAHEVARLVGTKQHIIVMQGHKEGIIAYGKSIEEVGTLLLSFMKKIVK